MKWDGGEKMEKDHTICRREKCSDKRMSADRVDIDMLKGMYPNADATLCFTCTFWLNLCGSNGLVSESWAHYSLTSEDSPIKGFDGRTFKITILDNFRNADVGISSEFLGKTFEHSNVWTQGTIPETFRDAYIACPAKIFVEISGLR
jgi:hypothetical protein